MQKNDLIGIAAVFILTFFLLLVYHLMSKLGRPGKRYGFQSERGEGRPRPGRSSRFAAEARAGRTGFDRAEGSTPTSRELRDTQKQKRRLTLR